MARILLGISGSIAAYKAPLLVRLLVEQGHEVSTVLSQSAEKFVTPLSLATVSGSEVLTQASFFSHTIPHLERQADVLLVAPATANMLAKFALGLADDVLSTVFLSFRGPKIVAPAMHTEMWENPIVQEHIVRLRGLGVWVVGPDSGDLACGDVGVGRMVDINLLGLAVNVCLLTGLDFFGQRLLITAGGTKESLDSMRVLTNRSTGQLGEKLAHLAMFYGAEVRLITTVPIHIQHPGLEVILVSSFSEMQEALHTHLEWCTRLYMAAAVSDFTMIPSDKKLKRKPEGLSLSLDATPDLLSEMSSQKGDRVFVGFCLDDGELLTVAREKLLKKGLDYIVANRPESVGATHRSIHVLSRTDQAIHTLENASLLEVVYSILNWTKN